MNVKDFNCLCTTFDPKAIERIKFYVNHFDSLCDELEKVDGVEIGSWSTFNTYILRKRGPGIYLLDDYQVKSIGIEDEHTIGVIVEK